MAKIQNISEIHPTLGFTEFDILEKYRSDSGFCAVRPVRLERSAKAFLQSAELLASSSDTTGRTFGKPNRILVPAPMVFRHKTLHLTAELTGKENTARNLQ